MQIQAEASLSIQYQPAPASTGLLRPASAWICKRIKNALSSGYQDLMGHLILTTSPWSILNWITLMYSVCCSASTILKPVSTSLAKLKAYCPDMFTVEFTMVEKIFINHAALVPDKKSADILARLFFLFFSQTCEKNIDFYQILMLQGNSNRKNEENAQQLPISICK